VTPPRFVDEHGRAHPTRPCPSCGRVILILHPRVEHLRMIGLQLFGEAEYVSWCGHR